MMAQALLLSLLLSQASYYSPEEAQAVFREANEAWARGDYSAAEEGYRRLLERGHGGPDVLYNLGTTHLAQKELGEAILYLERAQRAGASGPDVEANLALARAQQLDKVVGEAADPPFLERLAVVLPGSALAVAFLVGWGGGFLLLALRRLWPAARRGGTALAAFVLFSVAVPAGLLLAVHAWVGASVHEAVVVAPAAEAREYPSAEGKVAFEVHAGLKVRLLETSGGFVRIRLPNGVEGWTPEAAVRGL